ncbi:zinc finger protein SHOOT GRAVITROPISM 5 [Solanum stenotomum]|uniref:zinc finger protein SHOOT GRAVITROPISM 5 n=1 Tax=Solanum stenotomum TaxID=172797 RepID=UPI0020D1986F|nr:zinc finger protein SHOOT GRAVITROPISM 5 [Solanum stenotomum]XP_049395430.1 zinc finger protein SHOOT GRAVITROPISM 5 [Solanum stenotomum]
MEDDQKELHFLSTQQNAANSSSWPSDSSGNMESIEPPSLDLQLSISVRRPIKPPSHHNNQGILIRPAINHDHNHYSTDVRFDSGYVEALKWQAAEQIRLAAIEKAYAERVRELTRREIEMAQSEFARARSMWERAKEEVERAEKLKERATRRIDPTCMEVTCQSCSKKFRPH